MKIFISDTGERDVGIFPIHMTLDTGLPADNFTDENHRKDLRKAIMGVFPEVFDLVGAVDVHFEDECPDCLKQLVNKKCTNQSCFNSQW